MSNTSFRYYLKHMTACRVPVWLLLGISAFQNLPPSNRIFAGFMSCRGFLRTSCTDISTHLAPGKPIFSKLASLEGQTSTVAEMLEASSFL